MQWLAISGCMTRQDMQDPPFLFLRQENSHCMLQVSFSAQLVNSDKAVQQKHISGQTALQQREQLMVVHTLVQKLRCWPSPKQARVYLSLSSVLLLFITD